MSEATKHPIDFSALKKGDVIETPALIEALGCTPADARWQFALLGFKEQIERERADLVPCIRLDTVKIMEDAEASTYLHRQLELHASAIGRVAKRRARVDHGSLDSAQRVLAESRDRIALGVAQATLGELRKRKRVERLTYQKTPLIVAGVEVG